MVQFLPCDNEGKQFKIPLDELLTLADVGIEDADKAMRLLKPERIESLVAGDPQKWPPILTTRTDRGLLLVGGRHRRQAAIDKKMKQIRAICRNFKDEHEVIEASFDDNLLHGEPLSQENKSDYVWILHKYHPDWTQEQIGAKAHVSQSTVSEAIQRREKKELEAKHPELAAALREVEKKPAREEPAPDLELLDEEEESRARTTETIITEEDRLRKEMQKTIRSMAREASKTLSFLQPLDATERKNLIIEWLAPETVQERQALLDFAHLIEQILEQQPKRRPRR